MPLDNLSRPSSGLLGDFANGIDQRKQQVGRLVMGLLSSPEDTIAMLRAGDAEAHQRNLRTPAMDGSSRSVMPEIAQQGREAAMDVALNFGGLLGMTKAAPADDYLSQLFGAAPSASSPAPASKVAAPSFDGMRASLDDAAKRLDDKANDWAGRKYKANNGRVTFEGDGPTRNESLSIGGINESRKAKTVVGLQTQADAIRHAAEQARLDPEAFTSAVRNAVTNDAKWFLDNNIAKDIEQAKDMAVSSKMFGDMNHGHGDGSAARAIRKAAGL